MFLEIGLIEQRPFINLLRKHLTWGQIVSNIQGGSCERAGSLVSYYFYLPKPEDWSFGCIVK